jgi:hypothetical protein
MRDMIFLGKLSADELPAPLENIGGFIGKLPAAVEQLFSTVQGLFARVNQNFSALLGLLGDEAARILSALRSVEQRYGCAYRCAHQKPCEANSTVFTGHIYLLLNKSTSIVSRYAEIMPDKVDLITVFRSADESAEDDATEVLDRLLEAGIGAVLLADDVPGVVEGTWEVRVPAADQARAEQIAAAPKPEPEDEEEVSEEGLSHELDFVSLFSSQGIEAEMEAISIRSVLEANGIPCVVIGSQQIPSLPFEVRVPKSRLDEALSLLEETRQSGSAAVDEA